MGPARWDVNPDCGGDGNKKAITAVLGEGPQ